jgi:hypothetical protein
MDHAALIRDYYRCFAERDRTRLEQLLAADFRHVSPFGVHDNRDRMLDAIWPHVGRTRATDIEVFGAAPCFMVRYRHAGERGGSMAEWIRFEGEKIAEIEVFVGCS